MKEFGRKFQTYQTFSIEHVAVPEKDKSRAGFLRKYDLSENQLAEIMPFDVTGVYKFKRAGKGPETFKVIGKGKVLDKIKQELNKVIVGIAPTAHVYKIPDDQPELSQQIKNTLSEFNYYLVELGLNVMLGRRFKIPEMLLQVDLKSDGQNRTDVTAYDMAPDDKIKNVKLVSGKISLGITKVLKLIPLPVGQIVSDLIGIEINPWEFEWGFDKYMIDASGVKNYHLYWRIYETNVVQGFNPTIILKARKNIKNISARVKCIYKLKTDWWDIAPDIKTDSKEIKILPA